MTDEHDTGAENNSGPQEEHPLALLSDEAAIGTLRGAMKWTLLIVVLGALALWIGSGWRNAGMFVVGGMISAASIYEWQRLMRIFTAKLDADKARNETSTGTGLVVAFFLLRLLFFAAAIYGSLKWIDGSVFALLVGLALAVITMAWQALRLLRS